MLAEVRVQLYSRLTSFREENLLSRYFPNFFGKALFTTDIKKSISGTCQVKYVPSKCKSFKMYILTCCRKLPVDTGHNWTSDVRSIYVLCLQGLVWKSNFFWRVICRELEIFSHLVTKEILRLATPGVHKMVRHTLKILMCAGAIFIHVVRLLTCFREVTFMS